MFHFQFPPPPVSTPISQRLFECRVAWRAISHDPFVTSVIEQGYRFHFKSRPPSSRPSAPVFSGTPQQSADLARQLREWEASGVIEIDTSDPSRRVSSLLFPVPKKDTVEFRWCHDDRYLNDWLKPQSVKYETIESVRQMIRRRDYLTSIDLKSAYSHIVIHPSHRHLLGFNALGRRWRFRCLPFGVSSAPYVFTRVMRTVVRYFRQRGIRLAIYLDDIIIMAASPEQSRLHTRFVLDVLERLGFLINISKSSLEPSQMIQHLGVLFDSVRWRITLPDSKILAIAKDARRILRANELGQLTVRMVAGLAGKLAAATTAMPAAKFRMRSLQRLVWFALRHKTSWDGVVALSATAMRDAVWCSTTKALRRCNCGRIRVSAPEATLTTDASLTGWGAVLQIGHQSWSIHGRWNQRESAFSSNLREVTAVTRSFMGFRRRLVRCQSILFRTDNTTTLSALNRFGSRHRHLGLAIEPVLRTLIRYRIHVEAVHLPGELNQAADALSRLTPAVNEWSLHPSVAARCVDLLRRSTSLLAHQLRRRHPESSTWPLTAPSTTMAVRTTTISRPLAGDIVDWFASNQHHLVRHYASRPPDPEASFGDAMTTSWTPFIGIWVPPINLIPRVISKIIDDQAHGLLIVPDWPSRPWFGAVRSIAIRSPIPLPLEAYQVHPDAPSMRRPPPRLLALLV